MKLKTELFAHQKAALDLCRQKNVAALYMAPRCGKTYVDLLDTAERFLAGEIDTHIIFAPNGVHAAWVEEQIPKHFPEGIPYVTGIYRSNPKAAQRDAWAAAVNAPAGVLRILTINIEAMAFKPKVDMVHILMKGRKVKITVDEAHKIKGPGSKRTKAMWRIGENAVVKRILSGTSLSKGFEDLYAQYKFLDWRIVDAKTFTAYKHEFVVEVLVGGQFTKITGYRNLESLFAKVKPYTFQVRREDCFDLPPTMAYPQYPPHKVDVSPEQFKAYEDLRKNFLTELEDGRLVEAVQGGVRIMRLQQVLCGHLPGETKGTWIPLPCPRLDMMVELVKEEDDKCLVWCRFQADVLQCVAALKKAGITAYPHNGAVHQEIRTTFRNAWRAIKEPAVLVGDAETMGTHWDLNEAGRSIFYSNTFRFDQREQAMSRNQSPGQTKKVVYDDFMAGPIDKKILDTLTARESMAKLFADQREVRRWLEMPLQN